MSTLVIKSGTTEIAGSIVKGDFSYFSANTTTDLGPTSSTGFYAGINAPNNGFTVYQIGGPNGVTARVATNTSELDSILISAGAPWGTVEQNIEWATNSDSVFINSGTTLVTYTIGQAALGGVIAYINGGGSTGTSGLVATVADISTGAPWGCRGTSISTSAAIGTGNQNTINIMEGCATAGIAARLCGDLTEGGYSDWYLPSQDELNALYSNKVAIGGFTNNSYWTSTEVFSNNAFFQYFNSGGQSDESKNEAFYVRAIRSF